MISTVSGDLLSASSLLLTITGLFYGLWYEEIRTAIALPVRHMRVDREAEINIVKLVLWLRAVPILGASLLLTILLAPPFSQTLSTSASIIFSGDGSYDAITAIFVAVYLLLIFLAALSGKAVYDLRKKRRDLEGPNLP